jgi:xanthine/CO dehydrogenase XdhC/CoxF family maturation factor
MTHELVQILTAFSQSRQSELTTVLASIVHVDGSSYRKEGTRMLIDSSGNMTGALSGGCVEKEVWRQAQHVFSTGEARIFKYDGRFRLGCEGSIYILIEPFRPEESVLHAMEKAIRQRKAFHAQSIFLLEEMSDPRFGTVFHFGGKSSIPNPPTGLHSSVTTIGALNRLCIFGVEHDALALSQLAHFLGWDVIILAHEQSSVTPGDFPLASAVLPIRPEDLKADLFEGQTAVVLMSHNYSKDLHFLMHLLAFDLPYIGLLGPKHRHERMFNELMDREIFIDSERFERIHGPVGLDIGSVTPAEIALSIMAEITSVFHKANTPVQACAGRALPSE